MNKMFHCKNGCVCLGQAEKGDDLECTFDFGSSYLQNDLVQHWQPSFVDLPAWMKS